ncbi:hypothetical protein LguiA_004682 [Lonicera macranthoides]
MPNGSLEKWLYSYNYCLTILERLNIMIDVASVLEYLHHGQTTPILHCNLKPSNVLLDKDMIAHVCDFGIAKLLGEDEFMAQTKTLATIGYMAPASLGPIVQVVDAHLIGRGNEDFLAKKECASSILHLALDCSRNIPTQRISMEDVVVLNVQDVEIITTEEFWVLLGAILATETMHTKLQRRIE